MSYQWLECCLNDWTDRENDYFIVNSMIKKGMIMQIIASGGTWAHNLDISSTDIDAENFSEIHNSWLIDWLIDNIPPPTHKEYQGFLNYIHKYNISIRLVYWRYIYKLSRHELDKNLHNALNKISFWRRRLFFGG